MRLQAGWVRAAGPAALATGLLLAFFWAARWHPWAGAAWLLPVALLLAAGWWRPHLGLYALLALLPVANQSIWSGWRATDEFDLLLWLVLAGGYARCAWDRLRTARASSPPLGARRWTPELLLAAILATTLLAAWRAWRDAGPDGFDWLYGDYDSPANIWRVGKSVVWLALALPWLRYLFRVDARAAIRALCWGMLTGLTLVCGLALWERLVYVGLWDFSEPYRTTAWFWEMHVGGGAIDAYLALATPFAFWALWQARSCAGWVMAAALLLLVVYTVLTTYSRGLCLVTVVTFLAMSGWRCWWRHRAGADLDRFRAANAGLALLLCAEAISFFLADGAGFAGSRMSQAPRDLASRWEHWAAATHLLDTPDRQWFGLGLGRLPAHYSRRVAGGEFAGSVQSLKRDGRASAVLLAGPARQAAMVRSFALTQRVALDASGPYRVRLWANAELPVKVGLRLCERHLLYELQCQGRVIRLTASRNPQSRPFRADGDLIELRGPDLAQAGWRARARQGLLAVSVREPGRSIEIHRLELLDSRGHQLLENQEFDSGLSNWLPVARGFFRPWHIDNLYLELWLERGLPGILALLALVACAMFRLLKRMRLPSPRDLPVFGGLTGAGALGMVISMAELPRIAFLLVLLLFVAIISESDPSI